MVVGDWITESELHAYHRRGRRSRWRLDSFSARLRFARLGCFAAHCVEESRYMGSRKNTKSWVYIFSLVVTGLWSGVYSTNAQVNVTQFHNHDSRDGLYIDSAFTPGAAANLARDLNFDGTISGLVYAQPLYIDNGPGGRPTIIAVTESNNVYALDAVDGSVIWQRDVGDPVFQDDLPCQGGQY